MSPTEVGLENHFRGLMLPFVSSYIRESFYLTRTLVGNMFSILV